MMRSNYPHRYPLWSLGVVQGVLWRPPIVSRLSGVAGNPPSSIRAPFCGYNVPTMSTQRRGLVTAGDYTLCDVMYCG